MKRMTILRLHDISKSFSTEMTISIPYRKWDELVPVWKLWRYHLNAIIAVASARISVFLGVP